MKSYFVCYLDVGVLLQVLKELEREREISPENFKCGRRDNGMGQKRQRKRKKEIRSKDCNVSETNLKKWRMRERDRKKRK